MKKFIVLFMVNIETLKSLKYHTYLKKHYFFPLFIVIVKTKIKKILKKEASTQKLKILGLTKNVKLL